MKTFSLSLGSLAAAMAAFFALTGPAAGGADKVTICHFTSSVTNPYVVITISRSALAKHFGHHGDVYAVNGRCGPENPPVVAV
jgi:ABC-type sugar transport system substrate-binding protein